MGKSQYFLPVLYSEKMIIWIFKIQWGGISKIESKEMENEIIWIGNNQHDDMRFDSVYRMFFR